MYNFSEYAARLKKKKVRISPDVDKQREEKPASKRRSLSKDETLEDKKFDINEFMKGVEYFPPEIVNKLCFTMYLQCIYDFCFLFQEMHCIDFKI